MGDVGFTLWDISIHAPREGSDEYAEYISSKADISIHAPREGSDAVGAQTLLSMVISIHAPREGSDRKQSGFARC